MAVQVIVVTLISLRNKEDVIYFMGSIEESSYPISHCHSVDLVRCSAGDEVVPIVMLEEC